MLEDRRTDCSNKSRTGDQISLLEKFLCEDPFQGVASSADVKLSEEPWGSPAGPSWAMTVGTGGTTVYTEANGEEMGIASFGLFSPASPA